MSCNVINNHRKSIRVINFKDMFNDEEFDIYDLNKIEKYLESNYYMKDEFSADCILIFIHKHIIEDVDNNIKKIPEYVKKFYRHLFSKYDEIYLEYIR